MLVDEVVCRYGVPSTLHSDQVANLTGQVMTALCKYLGMERSQTSMYHPQGMTGGAVQPHLGSHTIEDGQENQEIGTYTSEKQYLHTERRSTSPLVIPVPNQFWSLTFPSS